MSKERLFGTDGIRGVANRDITASLALKLGMAAGHHVHAQALRAEHKTQLGVGKPVVVIGRDTRLSGDMLEAALAAGLTSTGVDVLNVGIVPTPAVAQLVIALHASAGIVISASHNPFEDNGIKFFGSDGKKLADYVEDEIEAILKDMDSLPLPVGGEIGRVHESREPVQIYRETVAASGGGFMIKPLQGLHLVMDCANGAAFEIAPELFTSLGAKLTLIHNTPNGVNINVDCGSTSTKGMAQKVIFSQADAGIAFDGDADRVMLADENGVIVDGDRMMAIIALYLKRQGKLTNNVVVATIMSNVGLEKALEKEGVILHRTDVGDRYVGEAMVKLGAVVGGEQSGHILLPDQTPTGDGLVTALLVLKIVRETGKPLSELAGVVEAYPQRLKSIRVTTRAGWQEDEDILEAIHTNQKRLENPLWLSVRASGTEPLIRVMAQGVDQITVDSVVKNICDVVERKLVKQ